MCSLRNVYVGYVTHWSSRGGVWLTPMKVLDSGVSQVWVCWSRGLNFALRSSLWVGVQLVGSCCGVQEPSDNDWPVSIWLFPWPSQVWTEDRTGSGMVLSSVANVSVGVPLNNNPITCSEVAERFRGWRWVAVCRHTSEKRRASKRTSEGLRITLMCFLMCMLVSSAPGSAFVHGGSVSSQHLASFDNFAILLH